MDFRFGRVVVLALVMATTFAIIVAVMMRLIPPPRRETDYLVIGTIATFGSLAILFVLLVATVHKGVPAPKKKD
jgi:hypothetical protein